MDQWDKGFPPLNLWNYSLHWQWFNIPVDENLSDGPDRFRQGEIIETATEQAMTLNQAKIVNANANTFKFMQVDVALNDDAFALAA